MYPLARPRPRLPGHLPPRLRRGPPSGRDSGDIRLNLISEGSVDHQDDGTILGEGHVQRGTAELSQDTVRTKLKSLFFALGCKLR